VTRWQSIVPSVIQADIIGLRQLTSMFYNVRPRCVRAKQNKRRPRCSTRSTQSNTPTHTVCSENNTPQFSCPTLRTSSSAATERPRDALRLSVVQQYNSWSAVFYYWLLQLQIYNCVQLDSVLFTSAKSSMLAAINKIHGCVVVVPVNGRPRS